MSGVAAAHYPGVQVQNSEPHRHKHVRLVFLAQGPVHVTKQFSRSLSLSGIILNSRLRPHHEQRSRYALAAHVRDHQAQPVRAGKKEVVEVAAHLPGGGHRRIEFRFLRRQAEVFRQGGCLNPGGQVHLGLCPFLFCGDLCDMIRIVHNAALHGLNFMIKRADFVSGSDRQLNHVLFCQVFVVVGKLCSGFCQHCQRPCNGFPDQQHADHNGRSDLDQYENQASGQETASFGHHLIHIHIHTEQAENLPVQADRLIGSAQPAESGVVDRRRNILVFAVLFKCFDRRLGGADDKNAFIRIDHVVGNTVDGFLNIAVTDRVSGIRRQASFDGSPRAEGDERLASVRTN